MTMDSLPAPKSRDHYHRPHGDGGGGGRGVAGGGSRRGLLLTLFIIVIISHNFIQQVSSFESKRISSHKTSVTSDKSRDDPLIAEESRDSGDLDHGDTQHSPVTINNDRSAWYRSASAAAAWDDASDLSPAPQEPIPGKQQVLFIDHGNGAISTVHRSFNSRLIPNLPFTPHVANYPAGIFENPVNNNNENYNDNNEQPMLMPAVLPPPSGNLYTPVDNSIVDHNDNDRSTNPDRLGGARGGGWNELDNDHYSSPAPPETWAPSWTAPPSPPPPTQAPRSIAPLPPPTPQPYSAVRHLPNGFTQTHPAPPVNNNNQYVNYNPAPPIANLVAPYSGFTLNHGPDPQPGVADIPVSGIPQYDIPRLLKRRSGDRSDPANQNINNHFNAPLYAPPAGVQPQLLPAPAPQIQPRSDNDDETEPVQPVNHNIANQNLNARGFNPFNLFFNPFGGGNTGANIAPQPRSDEVNNGGFFPNPFGGANPFAPPAPVGGGEDPFNFQRRRLTVNNGNEFDNTINHNGGNNRSPSFSGSSNQYGGGSEPGPDNWPKIFKFTDGRVNLNDYEKQKKLGKIKFGKKGDYFDHIRRESFLILHGGTYAQ